MRGVQSSPISPIRATSNGPLWIILRAKRKLRPRLAGSTPATSRRRRELRWPRFAPKPRVSFRRPQQASATVERIRYDLRVSCVVEQISYEPDPLDSVSLPWLWDSINEEERTVRGTVEMCQVDYSQKVRTQASAEAQVKTMPRPQMQDYKVSFPIGD